MTNRVQVSGGMRIVIALGGNALLRRSDPMTTEVQRRNVTIAAEAIAPLAAEHSVVVVHGNGPQVGLLSLQAEAYREVWKTRHRSWLRSGCVWRGFTLAWNAAWHARRARIICGAACSFYSLRRNVCACLDFPRCWPKAN